MTKRMWARIPWGIPAVCLLCTTLLAGANNRPAIGRVLVSSGASLDGIGLPNQGTILNAETLSTSKGGNALVEFSPTMRASVSETSSVRFRSEGGKLYGEISSGVLVVEKRAGQALIVETPKYTVLPVDSGRTTYLVAMNPDHSTTIAARSGRVAITETSSGRRYLLPEGKYAAIPATATGVPGQPQQNPNETESTTGSTTTGKVATAGWHIGSLSHAASIALAVGIAAGTATAIAVPLATGGGHASPSAP